MSETAAEHGHPGHSAAQQGRSTPARWKPSRAAPVPVVRCEMIKADGEQCKKWSLRGYTKCIKHAGPQAKMKDGNVTKYTQAVIEAARLRLVEDSDVALDVIQDLIKPGTSEGIRLKAATEILDRAGIRGGVELKVDAEITTNPSDEIASRLLKLAEGARAVEEMKKRAAAEDDIVEGEVVDEQDTLF